MNANLFGHDIAVQARRVLAENDRTTHTIPARGLYPHQWLWDSCFIAIGLRHYDPDRAATELRSLVLGQWHNGMLPHMLFHGSDAKTLHEQIWNVKRNPYAPKKIATSGITQPPMLAEATWQVAQMLSETKRVALMKHMLPSLIKHHQWIYHDRDPHNEGLALLIHPWESGMDNSPAWMQEMYINRVPNWIRLVDILQLEKLAAWFRWDRRQHISLAQRAETIDELILYSVQRRLRHKRYDIHAILRHGHFAIEDLAFNSILVRANSILKDIARELNVKLPVDLVERMHKTEHALELLWSETHGQYFSRNFATHELIPVPTISTLLPLYAGTITKARASELVRYMKNRRNFWTHTPLPTVPVRSTYYSAHRYWQGPTWVNTNWLVIDGLRRYGYRAEADHIAEKTIKAIEFAGMREYFDAHTGMGLGADGFSWTASLVIDMLAQQKNR